MASSSRDDALVAGFLSEVKQVEKRDSVLTKEAQIERLTKAGSKYGNLNPFAVLMVAYDADDDSIRKSFRKLSILTHPDKNPDQKELAQRAFDAVKAAYATLSDPAKKETCLNVVQNAKKDLDEEITRKRKEMRANHKTVIVPEDEPGVYKQQLHKKAVKLFADLERLRQEIADRESDMRRNVAESEIADKRQAEREKEFKKNFEATRQKRTDSWNAFQGKGKEAKKEKKKKKPKGFFKPPKNKIEKRWKRKTATIILNKCV